MEISWQRWVWSSEDVLGCRVCESSGYPTIDTWGVAELTEGECAEQERQKKEHATLQNPKIKGAKLRKETAKEPSEQWKENQKWCPRSNQRGLLCKPLVLPWLMWLWKPGWQSGRKSEANGGSRGGQRRKGSKLFLALERVLRKG